MGGCELSPSDLEGGSCTAVIQSKIGSPSVARLGGVTAQTSFGITLLPGEIAALAVSAKDVWGVIADVALAETRDEGWVGRAEGAFEERGGEAFVIACDEGV